MTTFTSPNDPAGTAGDAALLVADLPSRIAGYADAAADAARSLPSLAAVAAPSDYAQSVGRGAAALLSLAANHGGQGAEDQGGSGAAWTVGEAVIVGSVAAVAITALLDAVRRAGGQGR